MFIEVAAPMKTLVLKKIEILKETKEKGTFRLSAKLFSIN